MSDQHNPPAFPIHGGHERDDPKNRILGGGMSLRDYFAAHIAAGMSAFSGTSGVPYNLYEIAVRSYEVSDAMLAVRAALKEQP